jgi:hypothetical protein
MMSPSGEQELHRVATMLQTIVGTLPDLSPLREGLVKAGLALSIAFIDGRRDWIEKMYAHGGEPLSEAQRKNLINLGVNPDV